MPAAALGGRYDVVSFGAMKWNGGGDGGKEEEVVEDELTGDNLLFLSPLSTPFTII